MRVYDEIEYARTRLLETIVMYKGKAVTVRQIDAHGCVVQYLSNGSTVECRLNELDINPVKLGYVNSNRQSTYITRTPMRRDWKQGLRTLNMRTANGIEVEASMSDIANTIIGKFPSRDEAFSSVSRGIVNSAAFSRNFSINSLLQLEYKGKFLVGDVTRTAFSIARNFDWVREALEEELVA